MRVLRFIPYFTREFGGPVNHARYLSRELAARGHDETIYTTNLANRDGDTAVFDDSEFDIRAFPATRIVGDYFLTPGMIRSLRTEDDYDLVHAHSYRNFQADLAAILTRLTDTPFVLTAHGTLKSINWKDGLVKGFYDVVTLRSGLRWADRCVAVARAEVDQYLDAGVSREKVDVIHHGVDVDRFSPTVDPGEFVERHGLEDAQFVLYAGRLHERKGIQYLIPAIRELAADHEDLALVVAGPDYGFRADLEELCRELGCADLVRFVGHLDQDQLIQAYNAAYLVCYPSKYEIFGHTLTEASACGTPCVATSWGAARTIIKDGITGRLIDGYGNVEELVSVLDELVGDPQAVQKMGNRARAHILAEFSWEACADAHEAMYAELV